MIISQGASGSLLILFGGLTARVCSSQCSINRPKDLLTLSRTITRFSVRSIHFFALFDTLLDLFK